jgi:hypothetical protein
MGRTKRKSGSGTSHSTSFDVEQLESRTLMSATITTRYGNELVITGNTANDTVNITQSGSTLTITADGTVYTKAAPAAGVFVYTRGGTDSVTIDNSVTVRTTVDSIDAGKSTITNAGSNVTVWMDSTDSESGATTGTHGVASFAAGVSKALGAALANPKDAKQVTAVTNRSLFGTGPLVDDVNQGSVGDCWFMAGLSSLANQKNALIRESAVDMGDGTYVVQFERGGTPTYIRVSNQLSTGNFNGFRYASPGASGNIWAMIMEKAFCYYRKGKNTYNSISGGFADEVLNDFNISSTTVLPSSMTEAALYQAISSDLSSGKPVMFGTPNNPPDLVGDHEYVIISASIDSSGTTHYLVRNPWGVAGDSLENSLGYATITYDQLVANSDGVTQALS